MAEKESLETESGTSATSSFPASENGAKNGGDNVVPFAVGQVIQNRYKILGTAPFDQTLFRAKDLEQGRIIAVRPLPSAILSDAREFDFVRLEVNRLRETRHPNLLQLFEFEPNHESPFVTSELADGFSIQELLQARRGLAWEEALQIAKPVSGALDFISGPRMLSDRISPRRIFIVVSKSSEEPAELLQMLVFTWPPFTVKIDPLSLVKAGPLTESTGVSAKPDKVPHVRQLALLTYELLGGKKLAMLAGSIASLSPLPGLSEQANATLAAGFTDPDRFRTTNEFLAAMEKAVADSGEPPTTLAVAEPDRKPQRELIKRSRSVWAARKGRSGRASALLLRIGGAALLIAIAAGAGVIADVMLRKAPPIFQGPEQEMVVRPSPEVATVPKHEVVAAPTTRPAEAASKPVAPIVGQIAIRSMPPGSLFEISGANRELNRGNAPAVVDNLPVGQYKVRLKHSGWPDYMESVSVQPGATATVDHTFQGINVELRSDPSGATIFWGGTELGKTPLTVSLPPNPVELVSRIGALEPVSKQVTPNPTGTTTVEFKHNYGWVLVSSNRRNSEVLIEGFSFGKAPILGILPPGRHPVIVRAPGYQDQTQVVDVQTGKRISLAFRFRPSMRLTRSSPAAAGPPNAAALPDTPAD
jgi:PEGA domain-containing protein